MTKKRFSDVIDCIPPSGIRRFFDLVVGQKDIISLGVGEPDFVTPWNIREDAIFSIEQGYTTYTSNSGLPELRELISKYLDRKYHCHYVAKNEILITVGASEAADISFRSILNLGDEVILPEPCFVCYAPLVQLAGGKVVPMDTSQTHFVPDPVILEQLITPQTKMIVLSSPNNPTGAVIPVDILQKIAELAQKYDLWIMSDEIYGELTYDQDYVSFASLPGMKERTVLLNGFSKAFAMTGWRLGYLCGPEDLISRALKIHQYSIMCASILSQYAGIEALKNAQKDVIDMVKSYKFRRNLFVKELNLLGLETAVPGGAFYCFPNIQKTGLTSEEFALRLLQEEKVAVVPGNVFGLGGEGYIRCCYATSLDLLKEALKRMKRFVQKVDAC